MSGSESSNAAVVEPPKPKAKPARPRPQPATKPKRQPPYGVVVLNDDDHTYAYVIDALCRVCRHKAEQAFKLAEQIDRTGRAIVWTGTLELAELKRDQIRGMGPGTTSWEWGHGTLRAVVEDVASRHGFLMHPVLARNSATW